MTVLVERRPRVYAMARPRRSAIEAALVCMAEAEISRGRSRRQRAEALAEEVARIALAHVRSDDFEAALAVAQAATRTPAVAQLACHADIDVAALVVAEAARQLEARACRHLPVSEWNRADAQLCATVAGKLAERFRRVLK